MSIAVVGMLDEREAALQVIKNQIEKRGHEVLLIDISIGTGAIVPSLKADVNSREVVKLGGGPDEGVAAMLMDRREKAISIMAEGLTKKIAALHECGELQGILAISGMTGALIALPAMKALPFGIPKLLISSAVALPIHAEQFARYFAVKDITVMHAVVDTVGMNVLVRTLALNGANAISGMVEMRDRVTTQRRPSIGITEFGFCDKGAHYIRELLEHEFEIVSFHATGLGDRAAMELVPQGIFEGFIDLVPGAFSEYLLGGNRGTSGPAAWISRRIFQSPTLYVREVLTSSAAGRSTEKTKTILSGYPGGLRTGSCMFRNIPGPRHGCMPTKWNLLPRRQRKGSTPIITKNGSKL
jgi:uncharacterized protein (UPF0261 family)